MRRTPAVLVACLLSGLSAIATSLPAAAAPAASLAGLACDSFFDPLLVALGADCAGSRARECPTVEGWSARAAARQPVACEGVVQEAQRLKAAQVDSGYLALRPARGRPSAVYLLLHWHEANAVEAVNYLHLNELARSRGALVIVPDVPGDTWAQYTDRNIGRHVAWVDAVLADAQRRYGMGTKPVYLAGLSNGASMAMHYACSRADRIDAVMPVALPMHHDDLAACRFSRPIGYVQVHGTRDYLVPYRGTPWMAGVEKIYGQVSQRLACSGERGAELASARTPVQLRHAERCAQGRGSYLVRVEDGGHTWPDMETLSGSDRNPYGQIARNFDATLQGYDLLQLAAGR